MISLIVAVNKNGTIGLYGSMPWRNKEDLQHFRNTTMGKTVVMGRKTVDGLPKKLDGRRILTVSKNLTGHSVIQDFESFLKDHANDTEEIFVAGGGLIYKQAFPYANRVYLSIIEDDTIGDTFFDLEKLNEFKLIKETKYDTFILKEFERENG